MIISNGGHLLTKERLLNARCSLGNRTIRWDPGRAHFSLLVDSQMGLTRSPTEAALSSSPCRDRKQRTRPCAAADRRLEQRMEHEAGTRGAPQNHPRMDVASEGQATDRRA